MGKAALDADHARMARLIAELEHACTDQQLAVYYKIRELLARLDAEARAHFAAEEDYMRSAGYHGADEHAAEHEYLLKVLESVNRIHERGEISGDAALIKFLRGWFDRHVQSSDRRFAEDLRSRL